MLKAKQFARQTSLTRRKKAVLNDLSPVKAVPENVNDFDTESGENVCRHTRPHLDTGQKLLEKRWNSPFKILSSARQRAEAKD